MAGSSEHEHIFPGSSLEVENLLLRTALNSSIFGIIITDNTQPDNPIIFCNKAFELLTGYKRSEIIGHNCRFLQRDDRDQPVRDQLREAVAALKPCKVEIRNYRKDGKLFHNELAMSPVRSQARNVDYFIGVQHDITARKAAEERLAFERDHLSEEINRQTKHLKENEEYFASILETVRESLIVLSPDFTVIGVNEYFLRAFKVTLQETQGKKLFDLGNGQWNIAQLKFLLDQILPTSNPVLDFEVEHDFPHIGKKLMLLNAYRVELEGKYKDRILLAIEDITDQRALEIQKDDFLKIASHELKTPLTTIKGYVQMATKMVNGDSNPRQMEILQKTEKSIARLDKLISDLLDVSRLQSGTVSLVLDEVDFDVLVDSAVSECRENLPNRQIEIRGYSNCRLKLDEGHVRQVINNLISNAAKYSPTSTPIAVYVGQVGDFVKFSVSDLGIGIKPEDQPYIFERFFRAQSIQLKYPGMGIGLYICHEIIKNHSGTLWLEKSTTLGSTFSFTLPLSGQFH